MSKFDKTVVLLIVMVAVTFFVTRPAKAGIADLDPFFDHVKLASKRTRAGIAIDLNAKTKGVAYVPLAWHKKRGYWDIGLGYNGKKFQGGSIAPGFGINLVAIGHDLLKNVLGDRVGLLPLPGLWVGVNISTPSLDNISAKWDYKEKIDIYLTYAFFGGAK